MNYFKLWKDSIEERNDASYSDNAESKMFISLQSHEGLEITVVSFKDVCKFLLAQGIPYILSERFVKMIWKIILRKSVPLAEAVIIQLFVISAIMTIQSSHSFQ